MEKPFTIKVQEIEQEIIKIINKSEFPAYILKVMLQNIYNQIDVIDNEEINKYTESLKEKESDK